MAKQAAKKPAAQRGANSDRKNGKAAKKNPKSNPISTGKTIEGRTPAKIAERAATSPFEKMLDSITIR